MEIRFFQHSRKLIERLADWKLAGQAVHFADRLLDREHLCLQFIQLLVKVERRCPRLAQDCADIRKRKTCLPQLADDEKFLHILLRKIMIPIAPVHRGNN